MTSLYKANNCIKPISKSDVHRICSGQVVLTLATAVKELVENSLDAGATVIDVRFKDYGSEFIEVSDNGSGVHPDNFQALTLKHHTSKLQEFSDLLTVETFGFRGEALSSLCALSEVSIITRHSSSKCGTHLVFNSDGIIISSVPVARQVGTTVTLKNIFSTIPVRQKEFHRNLKREFAKMTQLLYAYCLVSTDVKIICTNQSKKERKSTIVSTQSNKSVKENIASIFGAKQVSTLLEWNHTPSDNDKSVFHLEGIISSCAHGSGRSASDRQFYYINSRPCEPTKLIRAVNEIYHLYNVHQNPFVFLNIKVPRNRVDVNVTPDKRQIFLDQEKVLLDIIRESLQKLYEPIPSSFSINNIKTGFINKAICNIDESKEHEKVNNIVVQNATSADNFPVLISDKKEIDLESEPKNSVIVEEEKCINNIDNASEKIVNEVKVIESSSISTESLIQNQMTNIEENEKNPNKKLSPECKIQSGSPFNHWRHNESLKRSPDQVLGNHKKAKQMKLGSNMQFLQENSKLKQFKSVELQNVGKKLHLLFSSKSASKDSSTEEDKDELKSIDNGIPSVCNSKKQSDVIDSYLFLNSGKSEDQILVNPFNRSTSNENVDSGFSSSDNCENLIESDKTSSQTHLIDQNCDDFLHRKKRKININLDVIKSLQLRMIEDKNCKNIAFVRFRALIDPSDNKQAEQELTREISKDMFENMEIIGQFNLGFIIARLKSDLFIIDQHATDEKYNFEILQKTTTLSNQRLVVPQKLELTPVNESILIENLEVFQVNGFEFHIDEDAPSSQKVSLTAIPMSKNWTFGKEDIDELLFMLQDSPHTLCRPSRVRAMFASRACRKSVMIGTALSKSKMKTLVTHMGEIEQPWNCPHGRPTLRHLVNLDILR